MSLSFLGKDWHSILEDRLSNEWLRKLSIRIGQDCWQILKNYASASKRYPLFIHSNIFTCEREKLIMLSPF